MKSFILLLLPLVPALSVAQTTVQREEVEEIAVEVKGKVYSISCYQEQAGVLKTKGDSLLFIPLEKVVKRHAKGYQRTGSPRIKKKRNEARVLLKTAAPLCRKQEDLPPSPTPTPPGGNPTFYFYPNGDTTPAGKLAFEIPAGFTANAFVGEAIYQTNCTGCHEKRAMPTMPLLRTMISQPPMYYTAELLPDEELASLTAYLNIFRMPNEVSE